MASGTELGLARRGRLDRGAGGEGASNADPLRQFIRGVQSALALFSQSRSHLFTSPNPTRPYLVFELLDRRSERVDAQSSTQSRHFRPYVYHVEWTDGERADLKNRGCLEPIARRFDDPNVDATFLRELIARYERWKIPVGFEASGVIWDAWHKGVFLDSSLNPISRGLFLEWNPQRLPLVETLNSRLLASEYPRVATRTDEKKYEKQILTELCLVHRIPPEELTTARMILVHYPLILDGFWFVGFAYFLVNSDNHTPSPLTVADNYGECLRELNKQHPSLKQFLKIRAMDLPEKVWDEDSIAAIYKRVVLRYFACFDSAGPEESKLAEYRDTAIFLPPGWEVPASLRLEWREFTEPLLMELRREVEQRKRRREQRLRLIRLRQEEATSRQMLMAVSHSIDTDLIASLSKLENALLCFRGAHDNEALQTAKWYIDGAKADLRRVNEFAESILQIQKHGLGTFPLPRARLQFPDIIVDDLKVFMNHRGILRLSGRQADTLDRFLEKNKGEASAWVEAPEPFTLFTYGILRAAVREILRNALRHIRPAAHSVPVKISIAKTENGALLVIMNNDPADSETVGSVNSNDEQPTEGQYGVALYKMIFKACGAQWEMTADDMWTTVRVTLPEVSDGEKAAHSPGG